MKPKASKLSRSGLSKPVVAGTGLVAVLLVAAFIFISPQFLSPQPAKQQAVKIISLTQQEWGFNQAKGGDPITVTKGDKVLIKVRNAGQFPHDVAIVDGSERVLWNAKSKEQQQPGNEATIEFIAGDVGTFSLICTIPGHKQLGMETKFIVQAS